MISRRLTTAWQEYTEYCNCIDWCFIKLHVIKCLLSGEITGDGPSLSVGDNKVEETGESWHCISLLADMKMFSELFKNFRASHVPLAVGTLSHHTYYAIIVSHSSYCCYVYTIQILSIESFVDTFYCQWEERSYFMPKDFTFFCQCYY